MKNKTFAKGLIAVILSLVMVTVGCTDAWVKIALADLPVLAQMALNIAALVGAVKGSSVSQSDIAAIGQISSEAGTDLQLLDKAYNDYKTNPNATKLQKIQDVLATLNTNLPGLLQAAHIQNALLQARVTAAVNLILTTVEAFAQLIPQPTVAGKLKKVKAPVRIPTPKELKSKWNQEVFPQF